MNVTIRVIKYMLMISLLGGSIVFFYPSETYVTYGQIAWYALLGVMFIRPLHDLFPKCKIFSFLLKFRRELGILAGVFGILHGMGAFMEQHKVFEVSYWTLLTDTQYTWNYQTTVFWGILAGLVALPLILTSNHFSTSLLKKNWKRLQRLSYFMIILVAIHIFTIKGEIGGIVFVGLWMILWAIAWKIKRKIVSGQGPKWLCVPCGYIYDESVGDPDSGIAPGTRFEDLPSDWRCPVCGVGKADFVFVEAETIQNTASIVKKEHLTDDVIELTLETKTPLSFRPGQFLSLGLNDDEGDFQRSYSIVEVNGNLVRFLIKIKKTGRAGKWFRNAHIGTQVSYTMATGKFILNQSASPKVFIATGTGLAPIYALLKDVPKQISKTLYFSVSYEKDLFYFKEIQAFTDVDLHIHITRESVPGLHFGRIDFSAFNYPLETEFYICGAGGVLESAQKELQKKGYSNIFFEKF